MAAAFLMEQGRRRTPAEFMREIEEDGIKFNIENTAEDIVNGLFCTYEPPTSKVQQYKAANAVRKDPTKYNVRPSVPKSILKFKIKKNTKKSQPTPTASIAPSVAISEARDDAPIEDKDSSKKSVTWRDQKGKKDRTDLENKVVSLASKYCGGACNGGEDIADVLSSPTGRATQNFFSTDAETPGSMASMASSLFAETENGNKKVLYDDQGNPIREADIQHDDNGSYFPSTPTDSATPKSRSEELKEGGHSNLFCSNIPFMDTMVEGIGIAGVMAASAAAAAGVPENLCSPYVKPKNPAAAQNSVPDQELNEAIQSLGIYEPDSYDQLASSVKFSRQSTPRYLPGSNGKAKPAEEPNDEERDAPPQHDPTPRSYAPSDITMGNSTIKHFSGNASVVDETIGVPSPKKNFSSMLGELKKVQTDRGLEGSSQHENEERSVAGSVSSQNNINSIKKGFVKSPRSPVVTRAYLDSIKSPKSPGRVADLAKQFESPRGVRKPIEPVECREFNGKMNFLPPTPRRKSPEAPVTNTESIGPVSKSIQMFERNIKDIKKEEANKAAPTPAESVNTDAEIRAAASSVVDVTAKRGGRNDAEATNTNAKEEREECSDEKKKSKKSKKGGFGKALKKVMKITKKVESQRIAKED